MKVSVVIPTYKRPDILPRAIESVLSQTYTNFEVNVVSDGFHKETDETMEQYLNNNQINYYSYSKNQGGNFARNFGVKKSKGKYIAFLDDDDLWHKDKLAKQMEVIDKEKVGLVYTGKKQIFKELNIEYTSHATQAGDLSEKILEKNYIGSTSCVLVEKNLIEKAGFFDERLLSLQDYDLWIRICQLTKVGAVNEPLLIYINEKENNQVSSNINKRINALEIIPDKYQTILEYSDSKKEKMRKYIIRSILRIAQKNSDKKNLRKYQKYYLKEFSSFRSYFYVATTMIPYTMLLKIRSFIK